MSSSLTGDGLEDYVYVGEKGATVMWKNKGTDPPSFGDPHLIADGPAGVGPEQVQFADVDGDGRIDYNQVGTVYGSVMTWHNLGLQTDGSIRWNTPLCIFCMLAAVNCIPIFIKGPLL